MSKSIPHHLQSIDLGVSMASKEDYEDQLKDLQKQLAELAIACYHNRERIVILLEGWDAAGKGGCIRRLREKLDPRAYSVYPIAKPDPIEAAGHYLQRFWRRLPRRGHISIFDRSWYGRVLVERIEGFASTAEWKRAYREINEFEKMLCDDGYVVIKLFLHISQPEQLKRYAARLSDPNKNWKLTDEDLRNRDKAPEYTDAYNEMIERTSTDGAPWQLVASEHKWYARVECLKRVVSIIRSQINTEIPRLSAAEIRDARRQLGLDAS